MGEFWRVFEKLAENPDQRITDEEYARAAAYEESHRACPDIPLYNDPFGMFAHKVRKWQRFLQGVKYNKLIRELDLLPDEPPKKKRGRKPTDHAADERFYERFKASGERSLKEFVGKNGLTYREAKRINNRVRSRKSKKRISMKNGATKKPVK